MSICERCGATFHCAMQDGDGAAPCWCTLLPPAVPVPRQEARQEAGDTPVPIGCWCPACLKAHIAGLPRR